MFQGGWHTESGAGPCLAASTSVLGDEGVGDKTHRAEEGVGSDAGGAGLRAMVETALRQGGSE